MGILYPLSSTTMEDRNIYIIRTHTQAHTHNVDMIKVDWLFALEF